MPSPPPSAKPLRAKEEGASKTILFNLSGHGMIDLYAYEQYFADKLQDYTVTDAELRRTIDQLDGSSNNALRLLLSDFRRPTGGSSSLRRRELFFCRDTVRKAAGIFAAFVKKLRKNLHLPDFFVLLFHTDD